MTIFSHSSHLAANGQRTSSTELDGTTTTFTAWNYDAWNRLKSEFRDVGNGSSGNTSSPNSPNSTGDYYVIYTFDPVGNRLTKVVDDYTSAKDETVTNTYNERDQLTGADSTINANDTTKKYFWDLRNRMTATTPTAMAMSQIPTMLPSNTTTKARALNEPLSAMPPNTFRTRTTPPTKARF